jgi:hypothetical protein
MILDHLKFGTFNENEPDILEITIADGVELDRAKLSVLAVGLCEKFQQKPYAILANRRNVKFHVHETLEVYTNLRNLRGLANLVDSETSESITATSNGAWEKSRTFWDRSEAISWLKESLGRA